jgi:N-acetylmuramic acid 6-phosphate etherase
MPLPPDRGHLSTEARHRRSHKLDALNTQQCVELMADDHRCATAAVKKASRELTAFIDRLVEHMREGGRLIYIGAGTSGRLGVLDASECPPTFQSDPDQVVGIIAGGDKSLRRSSEGKEDDPRGAEPELRRLGVSERDVLLGIAAGGTTPYVLGAIELAKGCGAMTGLLTCASIKRPRQCDHLISLSTGAELLTGSTRLKAGSATKLALNIITTTAYTKLGKVYSNLMVDLRATNQKLRDRAIRILIELCPELSRSEAAAMLKGAKGDLKTAIVMQRRQVSRAQAAKLLGAHDRDLRLALNTDSLPTPRRRPGSASPARKRPPRRRC